MSIAQNFPAISPSLNLDFANVQALDPRITYTRASTATYYNGVTTAKAEENLVTFSQEFDNAAWTKNNSTVTANAAVAPDGTTTAELMQSTAITESGVFRILTVSGENTMSVFAKENTGRYLALNCNNLVVAAKFDLQAGVIVGTPSAGVTASIVSAGNGWYRCILTANPGAFNRFTVFITDNTTTTDFTSSVGLNCYVWGAQLEQRSAVSAYTPTTTQPITNYIPVLLTAASGVARFDHNPVTFESLGLLIEEQRTNLLTYSSQFDDASWTKTNSSITANTLVAPDGTLTADTITATTNNGYATKSGFSSASSTLSLYVKQGFGTFFTLATNGNSSADVVKYNLSTGVVVTLGANNVSASITSVGNGWYRLVATRGATAGTAIFVGFLESGASINDYHYIWGAQLEAGAFSTSYIPTVASQVTRAADSASMTGTNFSSWYNAAEGTVYSEATLSTGGRYFGFSDGNTNQMEALQGSTSINLFVFTNSAVQMNTNPSANAPFVANKLSFAYKTNDCSGSVNSGAISSDTTVILPIVTTFRIMNNVTNVVGAGTIKKIAYYPLRLTDTQIQALTG